MGFLWLRGYFIYFDGVLIYRRAEKAKERVRRKGKNKCLESR